jgi:probable addiction module antidote protein
MKASVSHEKRVIEELRADPAYARELLKLVLEEEGPAVIQIALRYLALAHGMTKVAKAADMSRESLYRALSPKGNPTLKTIEAVAKVLGAKVTVVWREPQRKKPRRAQRDEALKKAA